MTDDDKAAVAHLATSRGWKLVERHIENRIQRAHDNLVREDFADLADMKAVQAEARAYQGVLRFVRGLAKEAADLLRE